MPARRILVTLAVVTAAACAGRRPPTAPPPVGTVEEGLASWYGLEERGRPTASGEPMDPERRTAAHRTLAFGTKLRVLDLDTGRSVDVVVNDRGPFVRGRIIDLSWGAARALGIVERGIARVRLYVLGEEPATARRWRVQVGSFLDRARAEALAARLRGDGFGPVLVSPYDDGGLRYHRVWVGVFRERDEAEALARRLRRQGHRAVVVATSAAPPATGLTARSR